MKNKPNVVATGTILLAIVFTLISVICFGQQFGRPSSNITQTETSGSYTDIDEVTASDVDYITGNDNTVATYETLLSTVADPTIHTGHTVRFRIGKSDGNIAVSDSGSAVSIDANLYQGATLIKALYSAPVGLWDTRTVVLTEGEAANITDYSDLRIRWVSTNSGGSPANRRGMAISWAELQVPDAPAPSTRRIFNIN